MIDRNIMIETERLILRPWEEADAQALFKYASDPAVGTAAGWPPHTSVEMSRAVIRDVFSAPETYAIVLKESGEPIGCCGIVPQHYRNDSQFNDNEAELGYWLARPYWGLGLTPEALEELITHVTCTLGKSRLWIGFFDGNLQSQRVAEKCGFKPDHTVFDAEYGKTEHFYLLEPDHSEVSVELRRYVESEIIPRYSCFDKAHREDHANAVIDRSLRLCDRIPGLRRDMVYAVAAFHDTGLCNGRERHHLDSAVILSTDPFILSHFSKPEIAAMATAVEDHRASNGTRPRNRYGLVVAEADRLIDPETIVRRTVQYGLSHYPDLDRDGHYRRTLQHLKEKYAPGGYLKIWIPWSDNAIRLKELHALIADEDSLFRMFSRIFQGERPINN